MVQLGGRALIGEQSIMVLCLEATERYRRQPLGFIHDLIGHLNVCQKLLLFSLGASL